MSSFVVVMALALQVLPDQQHVAFRGFTHYPMPHLCMSRVWFGMRCPGCGLTRSIIHLAHADWRASLHAHRLGWMMAAVIAFQLPYRVFALRWADRPVFGPRACTAIAFAIIGLLIGNWLFDLALHRSVFESNPRFPFWF
ncbi:MAG: DUF2752 domain-containing protein [Isosphaeraceae bacterium]|nr:DUF2752 domain-containing protein [Isosphaeraceae bacterium]